MRTVHTAARGVSPASPPTRPQGGGDTAPTLVPGAMLNTLCQG